MDIEIKNKRNLLKRIFEAVAKGENVIYNGKYIVNNIGATTYIDFEIFCEILTRGGLNGLGNRR